MSQRSHGLTRKRYHNADKRALEQFKTPGAEPAAPAPKRSWPKPGRNSGRSAANFDQSWGNPGRCRPALFRNRPGWGRFRPLGQLRPFVARTRPNSGRSRSHVGQLAQPWGAASAQHGIDQFGRIPTESGPTWQHLARCCPAQSTRSKSPQMSVDVASENSGHAWWTPGQICPRLGPNAVDLVPSFTDVRRVLPTLVDSRGASRVGLRIGRGVRTPVEALCHAVSGHIAWNRGVFGLGCSLQGTC